MITVIGDVHFCQNSSIIRSRGVKYSTRLENCLQSLNWVEEESKNSDLIVYLGDFFDTSNLNAEELSAFTEIKWNGKPHIFLLGNHEMYGEFNSASLFKLVPNSILVSEPYSYNDCLFLPYTEDNDFKNYYNGEKYVFSHNNLKGIQLGGYISQSGFDLDDITCELFINGHLHNGSFIRDNILNLGNLTGLNFSEDATRYPHHILHIGKELVFKDNPFAFNFYKLNKLTSLKDNAVITLRVSQDELEATREQIANNPNIITSRLLIDYKNDTIKPTEEIVNIDHIKRFMSFVEQELGSNDLIKEELEYLF